MRYGFVAALVALVAVFALTQVFLLRTGGKRKRRKIRRQRIYHLIRMTSPASGRTPEDSMLRWATIVLP